MGHIVHCQWAEGKQAAKWGSKMVGGCLAQADPLCQASALSRRRPQRQSSTQLAAEGQAGAKAVFALRATRQCGGGKISTLRSVFSISVRRWPMGLHLQPLQNVL